MHLHIPEWHGHFFLVSSGVQKASRLDSGLFFKNKAHICGSATPMGKDISQNGQGLLLRVARGGTWALVFLLSIRSALLHLIPLIHRRTACFPAERTGLLYPCLAEDEALCLAQARKREVLLHLAICRSWVMRPSSSRPEVKCTVPALKAHSHLQLFSFFVAELGSLGLKSSQ